MALIPWRTFSDWDPFQEMVGMRDRIDRLFDEYFGRFPAAGEEIPERTWAPPVDVHEEKDTIVVKAELPEMKKDEISIEVRDNILTLSGERKREEKVKKENYHRIERSYGKFSRSFSLPDSVKVDKVKAQYKDGVLEITLPKAEAAKPTAIPIKVEQDHH
ncbi:MAG: Hsp20/alpha crystallin family protein [Deltaproteobacteria bacterium]|nr:Hsp20/alpha crystallin family protein [Deltaproteobacteria bacterium]